MGAEPYTMSETLRSLEHFTILKVLGRGGMGVVYLARDERLGRHVALKVVSEYEILDAERRLMFLREARSAAAINHPNIATIHEVGETKDALPFIVMEYCEGKTATQLAAESLDGERWLNIARQISEGLAAAHKQGVIHRDIKGANIIIGPGDAVKILDFGLAKVMRGSSQTPSSSGAFFGTVPYISPEQARGGVADTRSDLFSTGVVLYELASGRLPFNADGPLALLARIRDDEPEPFVPRDPTIPAGAARIIGKLLQKEPSDRYQTADELADDLGALHAERDKGERPNTRRTSGLGRTIRPRLLRYVASAIGLAVVIIAAVVAYESSKRPSANPSTTPIRSIAVLPFQNLSGNASDSFLSVGLADALVTRLQQIPALQVRPTSATLKFNGVDVDPETAARELAVDGVLQGRFVTSGGIVRVNLQLTDSRTGYGVWAGTVDGKRDNLITLMDSVSTRTASALSPKSAPRYTGQRSEPQTRSPEAFEYFLRARALSGTLLPEQHDEMIAALRKAVDLDQEFAAAYADLSIALSLGSARGMNTGPDVIQQAERYARQAVKLDPNLSEAHLALGRMLVRDPERFRESARENLAALRLNPRDPGAMFTLASYLTAAGELGRAECATDAFVQLDPMSNSARTVGYFYLNAVDPERTLATAQQALSSRETELAGRDLRASAYLLLNDLARAEEEQRKAAAISPDHYIPKSLAAMIAAARGDRAGAEKWLLTFENDSRHNHWAALRVLLTYARLGDRAKALEWAQRTQDLGNHSWYFLVKHPWLESLQSEDEYQKVLRKLKSDLDDVRDDVIGVYQLICPEPEAVGRL